MRIGLLSTAILPLFSVACVHDWEANVNSNCPEVPYFQDADGDLWGDPDGGYLPLCQPDDVYTVRNNRDCDDNDPEVTGRIGSICPSDMVTQGGGTPYAHDPVDYTGVIAGESEFVVVHAPTDLIWAAAAEDACGPFGWGGHLATFSSEAELTEVLGAVPETIDDGTTTWNLGHFAGFVGFNPATDGWGANTYDEGSGDWTWESDAGGMTVAGSKFCTPGNPYPDDLGFLALVRDSDPATSAGSWCLGTPDEGVMFPPAADEPEYTPRYGHFICERDKPDPSDFPVSPEAELD